MDQLPDTYSVPSTSPVIFSGWRNAYSTPIRLYMSKNNTRKALAICQSAVLNPLATQSAKTAKVNTNPTRLSARQARYQAIAKTAAFSTV